MKLLWWQIISNSTWSKLLQAALDMAQAAGITTTTQNPMRLTQEEMLNVIRLAVKAIQRAQQSAEAARAALEPLKRENEQAKLQLQQLDTADTQLDEALTELRDAIPAEEPEPPVE